MGIVRPESDDRLPAVLVAGKQIFATHYLEGGLVNRSQVDMLRGFFGAFVRGALEDRVERQAPLIVRGLRARLESGNPPDEVSDPFALGRPGVR